MESKHLCAFPGPPGFGLFLLLALASLILRQLGVFDCFLSLSNGRRQIDSGHQPY
jgi:hypothetical protein